MARNFFTTKKLDKSIDFELVAKFCKEYYPELRTARGASIVGQYLLLQKNPWICALFFIKHREKKDETEIMMAEDGNVFGRIFGSGLIRLFAGGSFYKEVSDNLVKFLEKEGKELKQGIL